MKKKTLVCLFARQLGLETLKGIIDDGFFEIVAAVTHYFEKDMKSERKLFREYVKLCDANDIPLIVVNKNQECLRILEDLNFDLLVSNCYKYKLPEKYLKLAEIMSLNMHRSLLPKYKGLKPLKQALETNEKKTGTAIHLMTPEIDSGRIIDQYEISIERGDNEQSLFNKLYPTQYPLLKRALLKMIDDYEKK